MTNEHERAAGLLPWYVNGTLDAQETALVEDHLGSCAVCSKELARCQDLSVATRSAPDRNGWSPSPAHFARVLAAVDRRERSWWERVVSWVRDTPRPVRFAFALQGAALVALVAVTLARPPRVYETLSRAQVTAANPAARLHVVFSPDLTEAGLRTLLQDIQGVIVDGPSAAGVYTIQLAFPASDDAKTSAAAARLASNAKVRFATPVAR